MAEPPKARGISGRAIRGHLDLRADLRGDETYISRQSFSAPLHLSKPHADAGALVVHLVNPTAGFFDGDELNLRVEAGAGTRLVFSSPGASRVHRARGAEPAVCRQRLVVEEHASVEWIPEPFIPQAGARYVQRTDVELSESASLLYFEWIAPGRVARGEVFSYEDLRWELDLVKGGRLIARERYTLSPRGHHLEALRAKSEDAHYFAVNAAGEFARDWPGDELDALNNETTYLGHGPLLDGVRIIRALCADSLSVRKLVREIRALLYAAAGRPAPHLGRLLT